MNRSVSILLVLCLLWCFSPAEAMSYIAGDANADSVVNAGDVVYLIQFLFRNGPPPVYWECGDPNTDCLVNAGDIVYLIAYLFREGPEPGIVECGWSEPENLGHPINSPVWDRSISFSSDFKRLCLESVRQPNFGNWDVFYSDWDSVNNSWHDPINCGPNVNDGWGDSGPSMSADGQRIYFASWNRPGGHGDWDIWVTTWDSISEQWGLAVNLGSPINTWTGDVHPYLTFDGTQFYFESARYPSGIFVSEWIGGQWGEPVWLDTNINLGLYESGNPSLTADRKVLYFRRWTDEGSDLLRRIWVSYWTGNEWGPPFMLSPTINYPGLHAGDPWISPDGSKLYFSAKNRPGGVGNWDIWVSERIPVQKGKRFINRKQEAVNGE